MRLIVADEYTQRSPEEQFAQCMVRRVPWIALFRGHFVREDGSTAGDEEIAAALHDSGVRCATLGWAGGFSGIDCNDPAITPTMFPTTAAASSGCHCGGGARCSWRYAVEDAAGALRSAAILGARQLLLRGGPQGSHIRRHAMRLFFDAIRELLPVAEDMEVILAVGELEPHDLFPAKVSGRGASAKKGSAMVAVFPWLSLMDSDWAGLAVNLKSWSSPRYFALLTRHIDEIAPCTTLLHTDGLTPSQLAPLLDLFTGAGYDGDVLVSPELYVILNEQRRPRTSVPA